MAHFENFPPKRTHRLAQDLALTAVEQSQALTARRRELERLLAQVGAGGSGEELARTLSDQVGNLVYATAELAAEVGAEVGVRAAPARLWQEITTAFSGWADDWKHPQAEVSASVPRSAQGKESNNVH